MLFRKSVFEELGGNDVINNWIKTPFVDWALLLKASLEDIRIEVKKRSGVFGDVKFQIVVF